MCISNKVPGDAHEAGPHCESTTAGGGNKMPGSPTEMAGIWEGEGNENYRTVEAQVSISVDCHAIHHLMLNDKIILTKT